MNFTLDQDSNMTPFTALFPPLIARPKSQGVRGFASRIHPLLSIAGQSTLRAELSIANWLLIGCVIHSLFVLISPFPAIYIIIPTLSLLAYNILKTVSMTYGLIDNHHMENVLVGRQTAIFPGPDGTFLRKQGDPVGGEEICVALLSAKCNQ